MKSNKISYISEYINNICSHLDGVTPEEVIDALIGVAWDEEEAEELKDYES